MARERKARDPDTLSVKNTRNRLQRAVRTGSQRVARDVAIAEENGLIKPIKDWDLEELSQGRPRGKNGKFTGPRPKWLAETVKDEIRRRLGEAAQWEMIGYLPKAIALLFSILDDQDVAPREKYPYMQLFFDRVLGKVDTPVSLTARPPFEAMMADIVVLSDGRNAHPMIEGVVTRAEAMELMRNEERDELDEERLEEIAHPRRRRQTPDSR